MSKLRIQFGEDGQRVYVGKLKVPCVERVEVERDRTVIVFFPAPEQHPKKNEIERGVGLVKQTGRALIGYIQTPNLDATLAAAE